MNPQFLLAIESSCDDCAVAILNSDNQICADVIYSQVKPHAPFGGIVPEIASRQHLGRIAGMVQKALQEANLKPTQIEAIAVTNKPGLIGSLLVGVQFAKGFAQALKIPILGIHHIEGHLLAGLGDADFLGAPFIGLIASGGHSALYLCDADYQIKLLGQTRDDAAGEAFDKIGRLMGLNYPAGKEIDLLAQTGDPERFEFPIALRSREILEYSFSGLKTAARLKFEKQELNEQGRADFCAGLQKAISQALLAKAVLACERYQIKNLVLGGGVVANSRLRSDVEKLTQDFGIQVYLPPKKYCGDNAVMIAKAALRRFRLGERANLDFPGEAN
ncbi:MAG: tRNA (adenosine(37)-N6)-threonylcarbamoyltransferase complex transferase subunit TsaD [Myxococcaceae bacterium]